MRPPIPFFEFLLPSIHPTKNALHGYFQNLRHLRQRRPIPSIPDFLLHRFDKLATS